MPYKVNLFYCTETGTWYTNTEGNPNFKAIHKNQSIGFGFITPDQMIGGLYPVKESAIPKAIKDFAIAKMKGEQR